MKQPELNIDTETTRLLLSGNEARKLLIKMLRIAVPLWQKKVKGYSKEKFNKRASECLKIIYPSDCLLGGKSAVEGDDGTVYTSAQVFNRLAEGIALITERNKKDTKVFGLNFQYSDYR